MSFQKVEKREKSGQKLKKNFWGFLGQKFFFDSKPLKRKMTFFSVFDPKTPSNFFFEFLPVFSFFHTVSGFSQEVKFLSKKFQPWST